MNKELTNIKKKMVLSSMKRILSLLLIILVLLLSACGNGGVNNTSDSVTSGGEAQTSKETNYIEGSWHYYGATFNDTSFKAEASQRDDVTLKVQGNKVSMHYIDEDWEGTWELKNENNEKVQYSFNVDNESYAAEYIISDDHINFIISNGANEKLTIYLVRD